VARVAESRRTKKMEEDKAEREEAADRAMGIQGHIKV
jgi:hypothetical protein